MDAIDRLQEFKFKCSEKQIYKALEAFFSGFAQSALVTLTEDELKTFFGPLDVDGEKVREKQQCISLYKKSMAALDED